MWHLDTLFFGCRFQVIGISRVVVWRADCNYRGQVSYKPDRKIRNKSKRSPTKALSYWRKSVTHNFKGSSKQRIAKRDGPLRTTTDLSVQYVRSEEPLNADNDNIEVQKFAAPQTKGLENGMDPCVRQPIYRFST